MTHVPPTPLPVAATRGDHPHDKAVPAYSRTAFVLLACLTVFRLVYASQTGLAQDEAHYWQWSRHLDIGYYDQGPGVAYVIRLGTLLFGDTPLGVRFPGVLLAGGTGLLTFLTARRWFGPRVALLSLVLNTVAPLLAVGAVLATYDGPQVFFWAAALYALTRTVQDDRPLLWYGVGALVGLGLLCKLTMLLFAPGVLFFLLTSPRYRKHLQTPHPFLAFAIALAGLVPTVVWNARNGNMGFLHTFGLVGNRRRGAAPFRWFGDFLGGQALAVGPAFFIAEAYTVFRLAFRRRETANAPDTSPDAERRKDALRFVVAFTLPTLAICLLISLRSKLEINWPAPMHLTGLMAVAAAFTSFIDRAPGAVAVARRRWAVGAAIGLSVVMAAFFFFPRLAPLLAGRDVSRKLFEKPNEPYGWNEIADRVQAVRARVQRETGRDPFIAATNYRLNSVLAFYLPDQPQTYGLYLNSRRDQYVVWTDPARLVGRDAILVFDNDEAAQNAIPLARRYFATVAEEPPIALTRPGFKGPIKTWYVYVCRDFKGYDPTVHATGY